ncbi:MAG: hypothetical protein COA78_26600 [Blastopirellula sp.]|nr:MAG: hypothetical protein COA78_26600 [Blastopirellula sp.]
MNNPFESPEIDLVPSEIPVAPSTPKLSIADLMIWTACVAVLLTYHQFLRRFEEADSAVNAFLFFHIGNAILWGTSLAASIHWIRNYKAWLAAGKMESGHILVGLVLSSSIFVSFMYGVELFLVHGADLSRNSFYAIFYLFHNLVLLGMISIALFLIRNDHWIFCLLPWMLIKCWNCVIQLNQLLGLRLETLSLNSPIFLYYAGPLILASLGLLISIGFLFFAGFENRRRDWLHWVGTFCLLGIYVSILGSYSLSLQWYLSQ